MRKRETDMSNAEDREKALETAVRIAGGEADAEKVIALAEWLLAGGERKAGAENESVVSEDDYLGWIVQGVDGVYFRIFESGTVSEWSTTEWGDEFAWRVWGNIFSPRDLEKKRGPLKRVSKIRVEDTADIPGGWVFRSERKNYVWRDGYGGLYQIENDGSALKTGRDVSLPRGAASVLYPEVRA